MKSASAATLAILASGQYYFADLYEITIAGGGVYRFTSADIPLTVGGNTYGTQLVIQRGGFTQKSGLQTDAITLTVAPQYDHPSGALTIAGAPFLQAVRAGVFDHALVTWSKIFLSDWNDTTPGAVPWFVGRIADADADSLSAELQIESSLASLNISMPRNVYQSACMHQLFGSGCALVKNTYKVTGSVTGSPSIIAFNTGLTQADAYFSLGTITFTSGANSGISRTVKRSLNASGAITLMAPLPSAPSIGDAFDIYPGCDKTQATCTSKFNNLVHFRGYPYIPNPETPYDGGAAAPPAPTSGGQSDATAGSEWSSKQGQNYVP